MRFALVFPHALTADALAAIRPLARLASYGRHEVLDDADAAVARLANLADVATAPLAALGAGLEVRDTYVLRADPVTFVAGRDDVLVAGRVDDMTLAHAASLVDLLNRHFADDGVAFHAPRADAWFATAREHIPVDTDPLQPNEPIGPHLPRGAHAATWRRWLSEMQMLLHEHPVNEEREAAGLAPATGIWLSGGGKLATASPTLHVSIHATPSRAGDIATGIARLADSQVLPPPGRFDALARGSDALVVLNEFDEGVTRDWLSPAVSALEHGAIDRLTIAAVDSRAHRYEATRPSWWRRMRAHP